MPLTRQEVTSTIFSFQPLKSLGPDGLHPLFFQKFLNETKETIVSTCMNAFIITSISPQINTTYICLIMKINNPKQITHYRHICLCSIIYKCISKIIVYRIWSFLNYIMSLEQCSFIPGRRALDNAIIVHEAIHYFKKAKGKVGKMLRKIDLEKAFERLEWSSFGNL